MARARVVLMESIEKLRKMDDGELIALGNGQYGRDYRHNSIANEIEREIAERYIEQPFDRDGVPIKVGETCYDIDTGEPFEVSSIEWNGLCWSAWSKPETRHIYNRISHVKPRTIEDVLKDCAESWEYVSDANKADLLAKYADELRSMGVSE